MSTSRTIATIIGLVLGGLLEGWHELGAADLAEAPALQQAQPVDREAWARKLAGLNEADWRTAFATGQELAALPDDEGFAILKANWGKIGKEDFQLAVHALRVIGQLKPGEAELRRVVVPLLAKEKYPEAVRALEIPTLPMKPQVARRAQIDPLADVADVPAQDLRAGGDDKKRYFLIGAKDAKPPAAGYGLLIVLPGGDGSADFHPFIRRIHKNVLNERWLIAEAVAPKWDAKQFNRVVWPTAVLRYPAAKFTTEEFIQAIVDDVRAKVKIDPRRVILLGWSSGGPPCYATALRGDSKVTGAFIAMSVCRPENLPAVENAKDKAFYLLQSPQDQVTPIKHAEAAEKALRAAGAKVRLQRYEGGHGWRGDIWTMIRDGIAWLDQQVGAE